MISNILGGCILLHFNCDCKVPAEGTGYTSMAIRRINCEILAEFLCAKFKISTDCQFEIFSCVLNDISSFYAANLRYHLKHKKVFSDWNEI